MKTFASILAAMMLALLLAEPVLAAPIHQSDMTTVTFKLRLYGSAPDHQVFGVFYGTEEDAKSGKYDKAPPPFIEFCGPPGLDIPVTQRISAAPCAGNASYTAMVHLRSGSHLWFAYTRGDASNPKAQPEAFFGTARRGNTYGNPQGPNDYTLLSGDTTISAYYKYGNSQQTPGMPNSGAGGAAGTHLPAGATLAALPLLLAIGYAAARVRATIT